MNKEHFYFLSKLLALFLVVLFILVNIAAFVPKNFPVGSHVRIAKDTTISETADILFEKHIISSPFLFKAIMKTIHGERGIKAGSYVFDDPQNLWRVSSRLSSADYGVPLVKVTIPEGATVQDIAWIILKKIPTFDAPYFLKLAKASEGYLFPDTYLFYTTVLPDEVFDTLRKNFNLKFQSLLVDVSLSGRKPADIVTMASIVEREATSTPDRAIIAGILWKRMDEGMPLQVDATIVYLTGDGSVSVADTKIDSPYNTYKNKGLPKGPISNPGLSSLQAAARYVKTPYYYYLADARGVTHYAKTFEGHQVNREKYLRK